MSNLDVSILNYFRYLAVNSSSSTRYSLKCSQMLYILTNTLFCLHQLQLVGKITLCNFKQTNSSIWILLFAWNFLLTIFNTFYLFKFFSITGKSTIFELAIIRALLSAGSVSLYFAPMKSIVNERFRDWSQRFENIQGVSCLSNESK